MKKQKTFHYLTAEEMEMERDEVNLQIVLAISSCKTKQDVCDLLTEIRRHEMYLLSKENRVGVKKE